ncbi:MAG: exo-alpha-sialidase [bacterium]
MNRSVFRYLDDPNVHLQDSAMLNLVWVDQSRKDVLFQRYTHQDSAMLKTPVNVSKSPGVFSWFPKVLVDPTNPDNVFVVWQEIVFSGGTHGGEIFFARSTDGGETFHDTKNLSKSIQGDGKGRLTEERWDNGSLDLAVSSSGRLFAAWTEYEGRLWFTYSANAGETFAKAVHVSGGERMPARGPSLATGSSGGVLLCWTTGSSDEADIRLIRLTSAGRPAGEPEVIHPTSGHSDAPELAVDDSGTVHLVYSESPAGPFTASEIKYARKKPGSEAFANPRTISGGSLARFNSQNYPSIGLDADGNPYILWELFVEANQRPLALGFTHSTSRGDSFQSPSVLSGSQAPSGGVNGSQQGFLMEKLSVNASGDVAVTNSSFFPGERSRILLWRGSTNNSGD